MKKRLENALQAISLPQNLNEAAAQGILRAQNERKGIKLTKTIKIIAAMAAALAISITAVEATALNRRSLKNTTEIKNSETSNCRIASANDFVDVSLLRQENGGLKVVALLSENAKDESFYGEIDSIRPAEFSIVNSKGETVAEGKPDGTIDIEASHGGNIIIAEDGSLIVTFDLDGETGEAEEYQIIINKLIGSKGGTDLIEFLGNWGEGINLSFTPNTSVSYVEMDENGNFTYYDENGDPVECIQSEMEMPDKSSSTFDFDAPPFNETFEMSEDGFGESVNQAVKISAETD